MRPGVIPHGMTFSEHLLYEIGVCGEKISDNEKGGRDLVFFQSFQYGRSIAVFVAGIEGQEDHFFVGIGSIVGVVGAQFLDGSVSCGTLSFRGEA